MSTAVDVLLLFIGLVYVLAWSTVRLCEMRQQQMRQEQIERLLRGESWL